MSFIRPEDDPKDVFLAIILIVIAVLALLFIPHALGISVQ